LTSVCSKSLVHVSVSIRIPNLVNRGQQGGRLL